MTKSSSSKKGTEGLTERATYAYDYRGLLVKKTYSEFTADEGVSITGGSTVKVTEWYEYTQDGRLLYTEKSAGSVTTETDYIWAETTLWCEVDDGEVYYHHTDHLGTTEAVTDSKGKVVWHAEYEAFGSVLSENGSMAFTPSFTGKMMDECSGLYYFNARWYDSECGRFTTSDPVRDGVNFHNYCNGNPISFVDKDGKQSIYLPGGGTQFNNQPPGMEYNIDEYTKNSQTISDAIDMINKSNPGKIVAKAIDHWILKDEYKNKSKDFKFKILNNFIFIQIEAKESGMFDFDKDGNYSDDEINDFKDYVNNSMLMNYSDQKELGPYAGIEIPQINEKDAESFLNKEIEQNNYQERINKMTIQKGEKE